MYGLPYQREHYPMVNTTLITRSKQMTNIITWRESNRKAASEYAELPVGVMRSDYSIDMDAVEPKVQNELLTRAVAHLYNNEAISACIRMKTKEAADGNTDFDTVQYLHDYRMAVRSKVLDGTFGASRGVGVGVTVDPITAKMQDKMHERLLKIAIGRAAADPTNERLQRLARDFPREFNANTAKTVLTKDGKTLGQMVSNMIASDDGKVRAEATAEVERERAEREARLATPVAEDELAESMFDELEDEAAE
jgi:hypothetical protein